MARAAVAVALGRSVAAAQATTGRQPSRQAGRGAPIAQAVVLARYLQIHLALDSPAGLDPWRLAGEFGCELRTIERYVERVASWGIALTRDMDGYWRYDGKRRLFDCPAAAAASC